MHKKLRKMAASLLRPVGHTSPSRSPSYLGLEPPSASSGKDSDYLLLRIAPIRLSVSSGGLGRRSPVFLSLDVPHWSMSGSGKRIEAVK